MNEDRSILVAEDDESDVLLLGRAFKEAGLPHPVQFVPDGQAAIDTLSQHCRMDKDHLPALVILDLKMPRRTGMDVLLWLRQESVLRCLPVIMFSSSSRREEIERAYALGANSFIVKPASTVQRTELARFLKGWMQFTQPPLVTTEGFKAAQAAHATRAFDRAAVP